VVGVLEGVVGVFGRGGLAGLEADAAFVDIGAGFAEDLLTLNFCVLAVGAAFVVGPAVKAALEIAFVLFISPDFVPFSTADDAFSGLFPNLEAAAAAAAAAVAAAWPFGACPSTLSLSGNGDSTATSGIVSEIALLCFLAWYSSAIDFFFSTMALASASSFMLKLPRRFAISLSVLVSLFNPNCIPSCPPRSTATKLVRTLERGRGEVPLLPGDELVVFTLMSCRRRSTAGVAETARS
jgi:hypothetical protein